MENGRLETAARFPLFGRSLAEFRRRSGGIGCNHFPARRVRGGKSISARKRGNRPRERTVPALRRAAALSKKGRSRFFDAKRAAGDSRPFSVVRKASQSSAAAAADFFALVTKKLHLPRLRQADGPDRTGDFSVVFTVFFGFPRFSPSFPQKR